MLYPNKEVWKGFIWTKEELDQEERDLILSINHPTCDKKIPGRTEIETGKTNHMHTEDLTHSINNASGKMTNNNPLIPDVPFHLGPVYRPPPKPIKQDVAYHQSSQSSMYRRY